jgi:hypothetical protein
MKGYAVGLHELLEESKTKIKINIDFHFCKIKISQVSLDLGKIKIRISLLKGSVNELVIYNHFPQSWLPMKVVLLTREYNFYPVLVGQDF